MTNQTSEDKIRRLNAMLSSFEVAMLTAIQPQDGSLHSRPMMTHISHFDGRLWFFSRFSSAKIDEIRANAQVNLSFASHNGGLYISVTGVASIERDRKKMQELWNEIYRAWFPLGLDDPELTLLRVDVVEAEIWENAGQPGGERIRFA